MRRVLADYALPLMLSVGILVTGLVLMVASSMLAGAILAGCGLMFCSLGVLELRAEVTRE